MKGKILAGLIAALMWGGAAFAQTSTQITQTPTNLQSSTFLYGMGGAGGNGVVTGCNTASATVANDTITIPAQTGLTIVIDGFYASFTELNATGTGVASYTVSTTNINGGPFWDFSSVTNTTGTDKRVIAEPFPNGLRAAQAGVAVTFVPSGAMDANHLLCMRVAAHYAQ